ncbi:hypothetical protein [Kiloniella antarctica]|uniref:Secreted protein n=1 Tax=Kiloniella antarctica TaxID=1550907 RepID=A0ABW5BFQ0_9PROT
MQLVKSCQAWLQGAVAVVSIMFVTTSSALAAGDHAVGQGGNGEFFMAAIPDGWQALPRVTEVQQTSAEWLPMGQTVENWTDMITVQVFPGWAEGDVSVFLDELADIYKKNCEVSGATPPLKDQVNGFLTGFRLINCTRDLTRNSGEVSLFRALIGKNAAYLIQRVFRVPEFEIGAKPVTDEVMVKAFGSISSIGACQLNSQQYTCADWNPILAKLNNKPSVIIIKAPK